ncbi:PIN domain-containing protein [Nonomuraea sp. NPDC046570]|uniref:PIN domain-containing protein n=1 Tax=Nonomuraea sp. NPDC046570 TaxID=3155255 RepID=UPI00340DD95A
MSDFTPTPYVLDTGVLIEIARGDSDLIGFMQHYDQTGQPLVVPSLAVTGALLDTRSEDAEALMVGLSAFEVVEVAPLGGVEQASTLADVITRTGLSPWDAHVAAIAGVAVCPILTLDQRRWAEASDALDGQLFFIEIAEPE